MASAAKDITLWRGHENVTGGCDALAGRREALPPRLRSDMLFFGRRASPLTVPESGDENGTDLGRDHGKDAPGAGVRP